MEFTSIFIHAMYTICMCIVVGCVMSAGYISGGDLVTQWFPKKKGIVMGYTTMGHNLASVAYVPLITFLVGRYGIGNGVVSQMVLRNMELGFSRTQATLILSLVACIGLVGSFFIGFIDERMGTKKAMIIFGVWYALSLFANATNNTVLVYLSIFMIGMSIGGSANFTTSLTTSVFGRQGFSKVNSVIFPIQGAVSAFSFVVNGMVSNITGGSLRYSYVIFGIISILSMLLVLFVDEYRFNKDWHQGKTIEEKK
ncbi:MFS family permease [Catenibacillus scindens]|uniref:MFS family permease n=1 Tax=Catenibacillus scindens TaxID=673271 RepID=A0A7W8HA60_9FIRM|nr:MFS family permease [Catenibacillus scindens]